jgi:hypothetical protein
VSHDPVVRGARRLRFALDAAIVAVALLYLLARLEIDVGAFKVAFGDPLAPGPAAWLLDVGIVLLLVAFVRLHQMLTLLGAGEMFSIGVVRRFRDFAFWLLLAAACGFAATLFGHLSGGQAHDGAVRLALDMRQLLFLAIAALLFLIARLLERAREFEQDSKEIV